MASNSQSVHRYRKATIRCTASRHHTILTLPTIHIEKYRFYSRPLHRIGYNGVIGLPIATISQPLSKHVTTLQDDIDDLHIHIRLLYLGFSRIRVRCRSFHVDIGRTHLKIFTQIQRVTTSAHIIKSTFLYKHRPPHKAYFDSSLLPGTLAMIFTSHILMVVTISQDTITPLLYNISAHTCPEYDLCSSRFSATTTSGRQGKPCNGCAALVLQCNGLLPLFFSHITIKKSSSLYFIKSPGYGTIRHGVRTLGIKAFVYLNLVKFHMNITLTVRDHLLPIHRHTLYRTLAAKVFPAYDLFPT